jgi:hypothetical protein
VGGQHHAPAAFQFGFYFMQIYKFWLMLNYIAFHKRKSTTLKLVFFYGWGVEVVKKFILHVAAFCLFPLLLFIGCDHPSGEKGTRLVLEPVMACFLSEDAELCYMTWILD